MLIYIAGKITGDKDYKEKFNAAAEMLKKKGHTPVNPADPGAPKHYTYRKCIDRGLIMLSACDAILMLSNWLTSPGAIVEYSYAKAVGIPIFEEESMRNSTEVK